MHYTSAVARAECDPHELADGLADAGSDDGTDASAVAAPDARADQARSDCDATRGGRRARARADVDN